jgi:predicted naringenin-chalcone synthase
VAEVWLNRIGTAVPPYEVHAASIAFCRGLFQSERERSVFERMVAQADITRRYSVLAAHEAPELGVYDDTGFYRSEAFPSTGARMQLYEQAARELAREAVAAVDLGRDRERVTHLIVASCTGFTAPGQEFQIIRDAGLPETVERTIVGFMGCFAAVNALKLARHIVRSEPHALVLVVNVELCSLHLQEQLSIPKLMSFLLFADGASAALVSSEQEGVALGAFRATVIPETENLITWHIRDTGFEMELSGQVPGHIRRFLRNGGAAFLGAGEVTRWAIHAGGRSVLDAVQQGLELPPEALRHSRTVLRDFGNMSSATLMFVLQRLLREPVRGAHGLAMAFGPGLTVESFGFCHA